MRLDTPFYTPLASGALQQLSETLWHQLCVRYPVPDVLGYILLQQLMVALWQARELGLEQSGQFAQQADPTSRPMLVLSRERRAECRHIAQLRRTLSEDTPPPRTSNSDQKESKPANTQAPEMSKAAHISATIDQKLRTLSNTSSNSPSKQCKVSSITKIPSTDSPTSTRPSPFTVKSSQLLPSDNEPA